MTLLAMVVALVHSVFSAPAPDFGTKYQFKVGPENRVYYLHLPRNAGPALALPLVLAFHEGGGQPSGMAETTHLNSVADEHGFAVAYPEGIDRHWNDELIHSSANDVAFISALIDKLIAEKHVDGARVFATGLSNGGFFAVRLACELTDKIAAVAVVSATMPEALSHSCKPSRPISMLFMLGTQDKFVPINGGTVAGDRSRVLSLDAAAQFWIAQDHISAKGQQQQMPNTNRRDRTQAQRTIYRDDKSKAEVIVYKIVGGGHTWPGGSQYLPRWLIGRVDRDFDASEIIWQFFQSHPRL